MSVTLTTPNYTQFEKGFFITEAVIGMDTVNNGLLYVASGVKNDKYTFPVFSASPKLNPRTLIPVDNSTIVLSNKDIILGAFDAYELVDPNIFENHWQQDELSDKLLSRSLPATFTNYLGGFYTAKTFVPVENMLHMGSTTYVKTTGGSAELPTSTNYSIQYFDGIIKQALNVTTPAKQVAAASPITSANVIEKMEDAKKLIPRALLSNPDRYKRLKYIMSVEDAQKYEDALTTTLYKNNDTTEAGINKYKGYQVVVCAGVPEHTFYFCEATTDIQSNLQLAITSMENISFIIDKLQANSSAYFYKAELKMGVGIAKPTEFVIHTTKVLADFTV